MSPSIDPRFLGLIVHDLRNPLNVIGLSIRMIEEILPKGGDGELDEDFGILRENVGQIERMLNCLSDYCRQNEGTSHPNVIHFDPRRLLSDIVEDYRYRHQSRPTSLTLEVAPDSPAEAELDAQRARQAIQHALANTAAAAGSAPIRITSRGGPDRWTIELATDAPAGDAVRPVTLQANTFERLSGNAAERQGLELAIVAHISEQFGGSARLEVDPNRATRIVLDWPVRRAQT
jgi:signal transduction histidine kinase